MIENNKKIKKIVCMSVVLVFVLTSVLVPETILAAAATTTATAADTNSAQAPPIVQKPIYTVYFNANKGKVSKKSQLVQFSNIYGVLPKPTRSKYTFRGWYTKASGGTQITQHTICTIKGNQTLFARWQKDRSYEKSVLDQINKQRAKKKLVRLKWDKKLQKGTNIRAKEITRRFSHVRPNGGSGAKLLLKYVKKGRSSGECLGMGFDDPVLLVNAFMNSPTHRKIIMMKKARTCAISCRAKDGTNYWVVGTSALFR